MRELDRRVEKYLRQSGMAPTRFGRLAARDPRLVWDMRRGRMIGERLGRRVAAYLDHAEAAGERAPCCR